MNKRYLLVFLLIISAIQMSGQFYNGIYQVYGKNRVQYNNFEWKFFRFDSYDVYFYQNGAPIAKKTARIIHAQMGQMEKNLGIATSERIRVLVFNSLTDLKQSNVLGNDPEAYNVGGVTRLKGGKMFVYFNGSYADLERQVKQGLADVLLNEMIYGGFTNSVKNNALLSLPEWYLEGLISYASGESHPMMEAFIKDGFFSKKYRRLGSLTNEEARFAGNSIWNYIAEVYGRGVIKNLVFMSVANRNVKDAFAFVLGVDYDQFLEDWAAYNREKYNITKDKPLPGEKIKSIRKETLLTTLKLSANGKKVAFVSNRGGRYKVKLMDLERGKTKTLIKKGFRISENQDLSFPILAWHPEGNILSFITEEKGLLYLYFYNIEKKDLEKRSLFGFEKVSSYAYSPDGKKFVMGAVQEGHSDVFEYTILSKTITPITKDEYDDLEPSYINNGKQIVWSSNRPHDTLKLDETVTKVYHNFDLFAVKVGPELKFEKRKSLWRLTNNKGVKEYQPFEFEPGYVGYLTKTDGYMSPSVIKLDSVIAYVDTTTHYAYKFESLPIKSYEKDLVAYRTSGPDAPVIGGVYHKGRFRILSLPSLEFEGLKLASPEKEEGQKVVNEESISQPAIVNRSEFEINIKDYQFEPELVGDYKKKSTKKKTKRIAQKPSVSNQPDLELEDEDFEIPRSRNYFLSFFRDDLGAQVSFIFENPTYQPYIGFPNPLGNTPGFNMNFSLGTVDLMNDYKVVGAIRTDFQPVPGLSLSPNSEFYLAFLDHKKRVDKDLILYRRSQLVQDGTAGFFLNRVITNEVRYSIKYPFNEVQSIKVTPGYRYERKITLSDQGLSLPRENENRDFITVQAAFVHDNVRSKGVNLYEGLRYKVFGEFYEDLSKGNTGLFTAGIDWRHYQRVHREIIWANRFAFGTSFGKQKLLYMLGGIDNQINSPDNARTPATDENYIFQTNATNLRGFRMNSRNGTSFSVINSELRVPIFRYLFNRSVRNDFIGNFQVVAFGDVGTAWTGISPYAEDNPFTTTVIDNTPIRIILDNQKEPIIYGYGFGIRSTVFGYFFKLDWAWGVEDGITLPQEFYLSIGTDF